MSTPKRPHSAAKFRPPPDEPRQFAALDQLFARTVASLESTLQFDEAALVVRHDERTVRALTYRAGSGTTSTVEFGERTHYSERLWPAACKLPHFIYNAAAELDRDFPADRRWIETRAESIAVAPLQVEGESFGVFILANRKPADFDSRYESLLVPVSEFLAVAAERERQWSIEQTRHRRRVRLEALLPKIAESLDVRKVFTELSELIQEVIPHDVLAFALLSPDRGGVRVQAATLQGVVDLPEYRFSSEEEALDANWDFLLAYDLTPLDERSLRARISPLSAAEIVEVVAHPGPVWVKTITQARIRSTMRVPIRSKGRPIGGVAFMSCQPDAYDHEDGIVASRIADQFALALAHQQLAEEERRIAVANERALLLESRIDQLSGELERFSAHRSLGKSKKWKGVLADAVQVATTDTTVLVTGESGTGKEVIARCIHRGSKRAKGPFIALNCAALPEPLLESELFGHERGAFSGAFEARAGKIEQASGGLLFLDEVAEMSPAVQAKFLRVLQEREFQRVGGTKTIKADVRFVAATNRDPRAGIASGSLREDLYYRLSVFEIHLPPLRERPDDILLLAEAFLEEIGRTIGRPAAGISEDARDQLLAHVWPGNVRELRNAIERAVILCHGGLVTREHLPISLARPASQRVAIAAPVTEFFPVEGVALGEVERDLLMKAMARAANNKSKAAKLLGLSRGQLYSLLRRHGLTEARR